MQRETLLEERNVDQEAALAGQVEDEAIWLLKFNRTRTEFHKTLEGPELQACRDALESDGKAWKLPGNAYILVKPHQYQQAMAALKGRVLLSSHVVVSKTWDSVLHEILTVGVRHREILHVPQAKERKIEASVVDLYEERTFLCWAAPLRNADSVTESTTEAHGGLNPRRLQHLAIS